MSHIPFDGVIGFTVSCRNAQQPSAKYPASPKQPHQSSLVPILNCMSTANAPEAQSEHHKI